MTLLDVVTHLDTFDPESTIYAAEPWSPTSSAVVATEPDDGAVPRDAASQKAKYFIEVFVAQEFLAAWKANVKPYASEIERCERLVQYALNDA